MKLDYDGETRSSICNYIVTITANHYNISAKDIIYSNKRGLISEGRKMCYALVKEHLKITEELIGDYFGGRKRQDVNRAINSLPLNDDHFATKQEKQFVDDFIKLTIKVMKYRNNLSLDETIKTKEA